MLIRGILLSCFAAASVAAQSDTAKSATPTWAPEVGTHIRGYLLRPDSTPIAGWVVRYYDTTVGLARCARCDVSMYIPIDSVRALEAEHTVGKYRGTGFAGHVAAMIGVGAVAGTGLAALALGSERCTGDMCGLDVLVVPFGTMIGSGVGLVAGVVSGITAEESVWVSVPRS